MALMSLNQKRARLVKVMLEIKRLDPAEHERLLAEMRRCRKAVN